jgi:hypothetical protein
VACCLVQARWRPGRSGDGSRTERAFQSARWSSGGGSLQNARIPHPVGHSESKFSARALKCAASARTKNRPHAATNRPRCDKPPTRCERTAHTLRKNRPRCECENRPRSRRAASDPGLAQSGRAGGRLTGPVRVARTAGGAAVCGCARTYVRKVICLGQTYLRFEIIGSSARRHNRTFVQFGLGPIWTFVERPFRPLAGSLIFSA